MNSIRSLAQGQVLKAVLDPMQLKLAALMKSSANCWKSMRCASRTSRTTRSFDVEWITHTSKCASCRGKVKTTCFKLRMRVTITVRKAKDQRHSRMWIAQADHLWLSYRRKSRTRSWQITYALIMRSARHSVRCITSSSSSAMSMVERRRKPICSLRYSVRKRARWDRMRYNIWHPTITRNRAIKYSTSSSRKIATQATVNSKGRLRHLFAVAKCTKKECVGCASSYPRRWTWVTQTMAASFTSRRSQEKWPRLTWGYCRARRWLPKK